MGKSAKGKKGTILIRVWTLPPPPPTPPSKVPGSPPLLETFVHASSNVTLNSTRFRKFVNTRVFIFLLLNGKIEIFLEEISAKLKHRNLFPPKKKDRQSAVFKVEHVTIRQPNLLHCHRETSIKRVSRFNDCDNAVR